mmetsp:Transcript_42427/g.90350  ORF Transcript_42427/g.90350 Transcript_42427/m.90350 type:complete len:232 (+) Transcript_42427:1679-2374(+)
MRSQSPWLTPGDLNEDIFDFRHIGFQLEDSGLHSRLQLEIGPLRHLSCICFPMVGGERKKTFIRPIVHGFLEHATELNLRRKQLVDAVRKHCFALFADEFQVFAEVRNGSRPLHYILDYLVPDTQVLPAGEPRQQLVALGGNPFKAIHLFEASCHCEGCVLCGTDDFRQGCIDLLVLGDQDVAHVLHHLADDGIGLEPEGLIRFGHRTSDAEVRSFAFLGIDLTTPPGHRG